MREIMSIRLTLLTMLCGLSIGQAEAYQIYVSNEKDNTISVIDGASLEVLKTIKVGKRPRPNRRGDAD